MTPNNALNTSAMDAPIKTESFDWVCVANSIVWSCVLSPSSAKNTMQNVVKTILSIKSSCELGYNCDIVIVEEMGNISNVFILYSNYFRSINSNI